MTNKENQDILKIADVNYRAGIGFGILIIAMILMYIAFFK